MDNLLNLFIVLFFVFLMLITFFVPTFQRIESLEKLHNEYI